MTLSNEMITVFYDGSCPLCNWEITHLKRKDTQNRIIFEDIQDESFEANYPDLNKQTLDALLHVKTASGEWVTGLDATYLLWSSVGLGKWFSPFKWPWLQPITKPCYLLFAKYRHQITGILFKTKQVSPLSCKQGKCNE